MATRAKRLKNAGLYQQMDGVAKAIIAFAAEKGYQPIDNRSVDVYSGHGQTYGGLYLQMYYSTPDAILSPWGEWKFATFAKWGGLTKVFMDQFGMSQGSRLSVMRCGASREVYPLMRLGDVALPKTQNHFIEDLVDEEMVMAGWAYVRNAV